MTNEEVVEVVVVVEEEKEEEEEEVVVGVDVVEEENDDDEETFKVGGFVIESFAGEERIGDGAIVAIGVVVVRRGADSEGCEEEICDCGRSS